MWYNGSGSCAFIEEVMFGVIGGAMVQGTGFITSKRAQGRPRKNKVSVVTPATETGMDYKDVLTLGENLIKNICGTFSDKTMADVFAQGLITMMNDALSRYNLLLDTAKKEQDLENSRGEYMERDEFELLASLLERGIKGIGIRVGRKVYESMKKRGLESSTKKEMKTMIDAIVKKDLEAMMRSVERKLV